MPTMTSTGAIAARAFGMFGLSRLVTVTFTANGTWVAPAGVSLVNMVGAGSNGVAAHNVTTTLFVELTGVNSTGLANAPYLNYSTAYSALSAAQSALNSCIGGAGPSSVLSQEHWIIGTDNTWALSSNLTGDLSGVTILSVGSISGLNTSGSVSYGYLAANGGNLVGSFPCTYLVPAGAGTASTGIGKTFPGGTSGGTAPTTSFANVAVTAGNSYTIVVPSGGSVSISYLH